MKSLILFGGKGGVGKSTLAAATAVVISKKYRTLLISFDIAHSLSDIFGFTIGDEVKRIEDNLFAVEPDPRKAAEKYAGPLFESLRRSLDDLGLDKIFPHMKEIFRAEFLPTALKNTTFFEYIIEYSDEYDVIIADFPPTASMFALLEVPRVHLDQIIGSIIRTKGDRKPVTFYELISRAFNPSEVFLRNFRNIMAERFFKVAEDLRERAMKVLSYLSKASFRLVTLPEKASVEQIFRVAKQLKTLGYYDNLDMIYINNIIPEKEILDNQFLKNLRKTQEKYIDKVKARFFDKIILEVPKVDSEVVGLNALEALSEIIYKNLSLDVIIGVSGKFRRG
jgi:arsenite-transporting ATPase